MTSAGTLWRRRAARVSPMVSTLSFARTTTLIRGVDTVRLPLLSAPSASPDSGRFLVMLPRGQAPVGR